MQSEKFFKNEQLFKLIFISAIILLSFIVTPGTSKEDSLTLFNYKLPKLCSHQQKYNKPCPGCGLTRCFVNIAHGNIQKAYSYNKIGIFLFAIILLQIPIRLYLFKEGTIAYTIFIKNILSIPPIICFIALFIRWLINYN